MYAVQAKYKAMWFEWVLDSKERALPAERALEPQEDRPRPPACVNYKSGIFACTAGCFSAGADATSKQSMRSVKCIHCLGGSERGCVGIGRHARLVFAPVLWQLAYTTLSRFCHGWFPLTVQVLALMEVVRRAE